LTGHIRDSETGLTYATHRYYNSDLGIWLSVDPWAKKFPSVSGYAYVFNNPINFIDPDGRAAFYSRNGRFIGVDADGFQGNIYIMTYTGMVGMQDANLSSRAYARIYTDVLTQGGFDVSPLHNSSVSVMNNNDTYNDPNTGTPFLRHTVDTKNDRTTVTVNQASPNTNLLTTVENIQNALGAHELEGHGEFGYGNRTNTHHKVYEHQIRHPTWRNTTRGFKDAMLNNYRHYIRREVRGGERSHQYRVAREIQENL